MEAAPVVSTTTGGLVKRSISFKPEQLRWLQERGERRDRSVDWQIRELIDAAMVADQAEQCEVV